MRILPVVALLSLSLVVACQIDITNPEPGSPIRLTPTSPDVDESGTFTLTASRLGEPRGAISVDYQTADAGATAGLDYTAASGRLSWEDGDASDKTITIQVMNDLAIEGAEALTMVAGITDDAEPFAPITLTIRDDDRLGDAVALTSAGRIIGFDRNAPAVPRHAVTPSGLDFGESILGIDVRPLDGRLYALTDRARLYTIDLPSGQATRKADLSADPGDATAPFTALAGTRFGVDFNPVADRLRIVSDTGQNLRINVETGRTFTDTSIVGAAAGLVAAGYTSNFDAACRTRLYGIDAATDRLVIQDPPNDGATTAVGAGLGLDVSAALLDIETAGTGASDARAILTVDNDTRIYTIDLATGSATPGPRIALDSGETVRGFALALAMSPTPIPQQPGELYAVTETNRVLTLNRAAPAKPCTSAAITGLSVGDQIVGIDVRPSTGLLYALANSFGQGRLYTLDPSTGAAAQPVSLTQPLVGTAFGMDFNPTGPVALRIVSDAGQNLRVTDVATGATTADGAINGASGLSGAAYTNSVQGASATTLYTIDTAADRLRIQSPPNTGAQLDAGALGVDVTAVAGFEIDGRDNTAFAALDLAGSAVTTFHTINLATGAVSASLGTLGGGERLRGLTRPTPTTTVFGLVDPNVLVTISLASPSTPTTIGPVTGLTAGETLLGLDLRPSTGIMYGLGSLGGVYAIDPATAAGTRVSTLAADPADATAPFGGLTGTAFGMDFNPTGPVALRIVSDTEQNLRVPNVLAGATVTDTALNTPSRGYQVRAVAYSNSVAGAAATTLYGIDTATNRLVSIATPNAGFIRELAPISSNFLAAGPAVFDIIGADTAIAASGNPASFASLDLTTGAVTTIGAITPTNPGLSLSTLVGITTPPSAAPAADSLVYVIDVGHQLVRFPRNNPAQALRLGTVVPNSPDEAILSIDFRPSTGALWMLTRDPSNVARLYTLDDLSGTSALVPATLRSTLAADPTDTSAPFTGLAGGALSMSFNPTGPVALRIVSPTGQNLRVADPMTGNTFTDTTLATPAPDAIAAAYTNSFPGAASTTLLVIDAGSTQLMTQSPPNDGVLSPIGALSPSLSFVGPAAFDIAGGANGLALAALRRSGGETFSRLYRLDLATGAATELGAGIGSGPPLRGLAIRIR